MEGLIPVVLAYDLVHYESLEPIEGNYIIETVKLKNPTLLSQVGTDRSIASQDKIWCIWFHQALDCKKKEDDMEKSKKKS